MHWYANLDQCSADKYLCIDCNKLMTIIEITIENRNDSIALVPIYYCDVCNNCYKHDGYINGNICTNYTIYNYDLQQVTFSSPLTPTSVLAIDQALCGGQTCFEEKINSSLLELLHTLELDLLEKINRNHEDVVADLKRRVNSFTLV